MLSKVLPPHSLIIMGKPRKWWPSRAGKLARKLRKKGSGNEVIFAETE
jgi:hypothetical protein